MGTTLRDCPACGLAVWGDRAVCHRCGAVLDEGARASFRDELTTEWRPAVERLLICARCGAATDERKRCGRCSHTAAAPPPLEVTVGEAGLTWAAVELHVTCAGCNALILVERLDPRERIVCGECGAASDAAQLHLVLRSTHDEIDLAGPALEGRYRSTANLSVAFDGSHHHLGTRHAASRVVARALDGPIVATVSRGVPLCGGCRGPCTVETLGPTHARLCCERCGPHAPVAMPSSLVRGYFGLRAIVPDEPIRAASARDERSVAAGPFRTAELVDGPPPAARGRWWLLFDAPSLGREQLAERARGAGPLDRYGPPPGERQRWWPAVVVGTGGAMATGVVLGLVIDAPVLGPFVGSALSLGYFLVMCLVENRFPRRR